MMKPITDSEWVKQKLPNANEDEVYKFIELVGKFMYDARMEENKARELAFSNLIGVLI